MKTLRMMTLAVIASMSMMVSAQEQKPACGKAKPDCAKMMEMQADKMAAKLGLDDKTAAKFKTIYAEYQKELMALAPKPCQKEGEKCDKKCDKQEGKQCDKMHEKPCGKEMKIKTDAEVDEMVKARFAQQKKMMELQEKYYGKFRTVLSARQAQKVIQANCPMNKRMGKKNFRGNMHMQAPAPQYAGCQKQHVGCQKQGACNK